MAKFEKKASDTSPAVSEPEVETEAQAPAVAEDLETDEVQVTGGRLKTKLAQSSKTKLTQRAMDQVQKELIKAESDKFLAEEIERLRAEAGISNTGVGGVLDELVTFTVDLPYEGQAFIHFNQPHGPKFFHGQTYTVPRHVYNSINEIQFAGFRQARHVEGKSVWGRTSKYNSEISAKTGASIH